MSSKKSQWRVFDGELAQIKDINIAEAVVTVLVQAPDYFWTAPASSSGKHHPKDSNTEGGLVKHTKKAFVIAVELARIYNLDSLKRDEVLSAILLHDICKQGLPGAGYTVQCHAQISAAFVAGVWATYDTHEASDSSLRTIVNAVATHYGRFGNDINGKPYKNHLIGFNQIELIVHLADCLTTIKTLRFEGIDESVIFS